MTATMERDLDSDAEQPHRRRHPLIWLTLGVAVLAGAGAGYWFLVRDSATEATSETTGPPATAEITRDTISATETWGGTLGHGSPFTVVTNGEGTITRLAEPESEVTRGTELFRLNEQPVVALIGNIPMYRDLGPGDTGIDVEQLETNLAELGYEGFDVDDEFTWYTEAAVREWQDDIGAAETGTVARSDVVFVPEGGRVDGLQAEVGGTVAPGSAVLDISGSDQVVSLEVDVDDRDLLEVDTEVTITLPGGEEIAGTVSAAAVVEGEPSDSGGGLGGDDESSGAEDAVTEVEVTVSDEVDESLIGSPVDVVVDVDEREDVLVVPVNALLALSEGGYGLEVVADDGTTSIVAVEAGLFADGKVEVDGDGIDEGTVVGVAGR
jgi:hypothetical protein